MIATSCVASQRMHKTLAPIFFVVIIRPLKRMDAFTLFLRWICIAKFCIEITLSITGLNELLSLLGQRFVFCCCSFASSGTQIWTYRSPYNFRNRRFSLRLNENQVNIMSSVSACASLGGLIPNCSPSRPIKELHVHEFHHWWISLLAMVFKFLFFIIREQRTDLQYRPELHDVFHYWNLIQLRQLVSQGEKFSLAFLNFIWYQAFLFFCHSFFAFFFNKGNNICNSNTRCVVSNGISCRFQRESRHWCCPSYSPVQRFLFQYPRSSVMPQHFLLIADVVLPAPQQKLIKKIFNSACEGYLSSQYRVHP